MTRFLSYFFVMLMAFLPKAWAGNCIPPKLTGHHVSCPYEGLLRVSKDGKYGFINTKLQWVIPLQYDDAWHFHEGLAGVKKDGKWGFIDRTGKMVIEPQFDDTVGFGLKKSKPNYAKVQKDGRIFWIDKTGKPFERLP